MASFALDISFLYTDIGFGTYTDGLLRSLISNDSDHQWHCLSNELPEEIAAFSVIRENRDRSPFVFPPNVKVVSTRHKRRLLWSNTALPRYLKQNQIDLFHSVDNISLPLWRKPCALVLTLHDLIPLRFPHLVEAKNAMALRWCLPRVVRQADRIICDSECTRSDLLSLFPQAIGKAVTIYPGVDSQRFHPLDENQRAKRFAELEKKYNIRDGYILTVASVSPRRNLDRLLTAFQYLRESGGERDRQLVIAGVRDHGSEGFFKRVKALGVDEWVRFLGHVPRTDLPALYQCASCSVCVSLYEGFGFPVLESLACGTSVVASRVSSIPEVGGQMAVYVDPYDPNHIAHGMQEALRDRSPEAVRQRVAWSSGFHWEKTARMIHEIYLQAIEEQKAG